MLPLMRRVGGRQRTQLVDVDSRGRRCRERMSELLFDAPTAGPAHSAFIAVSHSTLAELVLALVGGASEAAAAEAPATAGEEGGSSAVYETPAATVATLRGLVDRALRDLGLLAVL